MDGRVTQWNDAIGQGLISSDDGTFAFRKANCSQRLRATLAGRAIPPGDPVAVTFEVDPIGGEAVDVDLAAAEESAAREFASASIAGAPGPSRRTKLPAKKKVARKKAAGRSKRSGANKRSGSTRKKNVTKKKPRASKKKRKTGSR
jgi:hypothetical protein